MKKLLMAGLAVVLIIGLVSVFAIGTQKSWYGHKAWKKSGEHNFKDFDMSAWLEKMGLPADASEEEIIEAKKALWGKDKIEHIWEEGDKEDYMINMREKFGLPPDASEEEVKEAWMKWKEENEFHSKDCSKCPFHEGSRCGKD